MLITERTSDGRTIVRLHKDWHPGRISSGYVPPQRNYMTTEEDYYTQHTLLKRATMTRPIANGYFIQKI
jgi:hypothetical protein